MCLEAVTLPRRKNNATSALSQRFDDSPRSRGYCLGLALILTLCSRLGFALYHKPNLSKLLALEAVVVIMEIYQKLSKGKLTLEKVAKTFNMCDSYPEIEQPSLISNRTFI